MTATDPDGDSVSYSRHKDSISAFRVHSNGMITVRDGRALALGQSHTVIVVASDDKGVSSQFTLTVTVVEDQPKQEQQQSTGPTTGPGSGPSLPASSAVGFGGGGGGPPPEPIPSEKDFEWNVTHDIESLHREHSVATDQWSDGRTLWILSNPSSGQDAVFAYDLASGERQPELEFELDRGNRFSHGVWSDGETVWVADSQRDQVFAYALASGERQLELEFELHERNRDPRGIWSDGEWLYVLDTIADALFVYELATGEFVSEHALAPLNRNPRGIWSDGEIIYVADANDSRVYSYNLPDAIIATLASLSLSELELEGFLPVRYEYRAEAGFGLAATTVAAEPTVATATLALAPDDAEAEADGHQVELGTETTIDAAASTPRHPKVQSRIFMPIAFQVAGLLVHTNAAWTLLEVLVAERQLLADEGQSHTDLLAGEGQGFRAPGERSDGVDVRLRAQDQRTPEELGRSGIVVHHLQCGSGQVALRLRGGVDVEELVRAYEVRREIVECDRQADAGDTDHMVELVSRLEDAVHGLDQGVAVEGNERGGRRLRVVQESGDDGRPNLFSLGRLGQAQAGHVSTLVERLERVAASFEPHVLGLVDQAVNGSGDARVVEFLSGEPAGGVVVERDVHFGTDRFREFRSRVEGDDPGAGLLGGQQRRTHGVGIGQGRGDDRSAVGAATVNLGCLVRAVQ